LDPTANDHTVIFGRKPAKNKFSMGPPLFSGGNVVEPRLTA
jgi:hypothetical protein